MDIFLKRSIWCNLKVLSIQNIQTKYARSSKREIFSTSTPNEVKRMQRVPYASTVGSIMVACYNDVGYLIDVKDSKYQTGYVFILNGGAIDSKSTEQSILATSSVEAEYIAALDASKEAV
ncbi:hypothetical protein Tco_0292999 [Tanacetum coccineum]